MPNVETLLRPCQCGSSEVTMTHFPEKKKIVLKCNGCRLVITNRYIRMSSKELIDSIVASWNTRPIEDSLRAELAKTQKALDKAVKFINDIMTGSCPLDTFDTCMFDDKTCDSFVVGKWQECWKAYFMSLTPEQFGAEFKGENK